MYKYKYNLLYSDEKFVMVSNKIFKQIIQSFKQEIFKYKI